MQKSHIYSYTHASSFGRISAVRFITVAQKQCIKIYRNYADTFACGKTNGVSVQS